MSDSLLMTHVDVDLDEVDQRLSNMEHRAKVLGPAFRALRRPLVNDQKDHQKKGTGPDSSWPPRSPVTEARRKARNKRTKVTKAMKTIAPKTFRRRSTPRAVLGRLPMIFRMVTTNLSISMVSRAPWSGAHMRGAKVGHGRKVTLPKRVYYYPSDSFLSTAKRTIAEHIVKGWKL